MVVKGLFGFCVSIAHNYIFIIHNSKYVGPMAKKFFWFLFSVFVSITQFFDFLVTEGPMVRATAATFEFFFFTGFGECGWSSSSSSSFHFILNQ